MSLHLEFEPHSWYFGAAITDCYSGPDGTGRKWWEAYYLNGMTGYIIEFKADTLKQLKQQIKEYVK